MYKAKRAMKKYGAEIKPSVYHELDKKQEEGVPGVRIDNCLCRGCGLVFNAQGMRYSSDAFYHESYQLMYFGSESEIMK